jgi:TetR/AcrR family acrAB operon transcriptional repressor
MQAMRSAQAQWQVVRILTAYTTGERLTIKLTRETALPSPIDSKRMQGLSAQRSPSTMARRTKEEAEETRAQILDAAERVFYAKGVSNTSLADIASDAGVTRGAIYWHFQNKVDVFQAILDRIRLPLDELSQACQSEEEPDPLGNMRRLLIHLLQRLANDPRSRRISEILLHKCEYTHDLGDLRHKMQEFSQDCDQRITRTLRNAVKRGQLPDALDCQRAAICVHAYVDGVQAHWLLTPDAYDIVLQANTIVDAMFDMLRYSPALRLQ